MAKLFSTIVCVCCLAASLAVSGSTAVCAAPPTARAADPLHKPIILKKIFAEPKAKQNTSSSDSFKIGLSKSDSAQSKKSTSPAMAVATSAAALIFVIGIFMVIVWFMKRGAPRGMRALPTEAFEILGRSSLSAQQAVQLVRIGSKLLLLASSTDRVTTLTEINDQEEVDRLSGMCMSRKETSATAEFHEAFAELAAGSSTSTRDESSGSPMMLDLSVPANDSLLLSDTSLLAPTH